MKETLLPTLKIGMTSPFVPELKRLLNALVPGTHLHEDNYTFGQDTQLAVWNFQVADLFLQHDGICGPKTWNRLYDKSSTMPSKLRPSELHKVVRKGLEAMVRDMHLHRSAWNFITSKGSGAGLSEIVGVAYERGDIQLKNGPAGQKHVVHFDVGGFTGGWGPNVDVTKSTYGMFSEGVVCRGYHQKAELSLNDFSGRCFVVSVGGHFVGGTSLSKIFFGLPDYDLNSVGSISNQLKAMLFPKRIIHDAKAIALISSAVIGGAGFGFGLMEGRAKIVY